jgi:hypothetical protein
MAYIIHCPFLSRDFGIFRFLNRAIQAIPEISKLNFISEEKLIIYIVPFDTKIPSYNQKECWVVDNCAETIRIVSILSFFTLGHPTILTLYKEENKEENISQNANQIVE